MGDNLACRFCNIVKVELKRNTSAVVELRCIKGAELAIKAASVSPFIIRCAQISCRQSTSRGITAAQKLLWQGGEMRRECSADSGSEINLSEGDKSDDNICEDEMPIGQWAQEWEITV